MVPLFTYDERFRAELRPRIFLARDAVRTAQIWGAFCGSSIERYDAVLSDGWKCAREKTDAESF